MSTKPPRFGELERAVMEHLWDVPPEQPTLSVREVLEKVSTTRPLAYTTVMTVLTRLHAKGAVTRTRQGRAWLYAASGTREEMTADTLRHTLGGLKGQDRKTALLHFLDGSTQTEVAELRRALAEFEARGA